MFIFLLLIAMSAGAVNYKVIRDGVTVHTPDEMVRLQVINDRVIRVSATPDSEWPADSSLVVTAPSWQGKPAVTAGPDGSVTLVTGCLRATVAPDGNVCICDSTGRKLLQEASREFIPVSVEGIRGYTVTQTFESLDDREGIYGLGQHQANEFNYKGRNEELFQYNTKVSVPFVVSTGNYGLLWDSYSLCRWGRPYDYRQLGEVFELRDRDGKPGHLTGIYRAADGSVLERPEDSIYFEHLIRGDLGHVVNLPRDFKMDKAAVTYLGTIEAPVTGEYEFRHYYSGYQTITIGDSTVVDTRWRTAWNPNSYKFRVHLEAGKPVPLRIDWEPNGGVAYCGLRVYEPQDAVSDSRMSWWGEMQDMADYYFIYGETPDEIIAGYRGLTGKAPVMPKWAMGYWQSREKYNTAGEVLATVAEFRRRNIPIDNIVIDWLHWPQDSWGSHEFDPVRFPDPKGMVDSIHAMNARVMVSVWPKFYVTTDHYKEFDRNGWMYQGAVRDSIRDWVGPGYLGSFYDAYSPGARKLFWSQMADHYLPLGFDAWWMDASEPNVRDCTDLQYRKDLITPTALGPSAKYFNAYALMNAEAIYNGQRADAPDRRVFLLTRSGFAGLQRYSTATWSGDIATRWEDMEAQIAAGLNFAMSGIPYWTMDIGGFCVEDRYVRAAKQFDRTGESCDDLEEWRELNTRWYQFGAFVPLFRAHGQWPRREVYNIAPEDHPAYKSIVDYTRMRYRLMPYLYSLAGMTCFDDYTIMRPMVMDFTSDSLCRHLKDQYMLGPSLLVAPVYHYGDRSREVYFPGDEVWYDFYTGAPVTDGGVRTVDAPYHRMPLYVRAGSIVPVGPEVSYAAEATDEPLTLVVYGGRDGRFTLYDDSGVDYGYENGAYSLTRLHYDDAASTLTVGARKGAGYAGMPARRKLNVVKVDRDNPSGLTGSRKGLIVEYDGTPLTIKL